ncbi:hypothetical protein CAPSP0001_1539 [Capnocytophaga sputigena ATCC 33612]|nr:hypothetical protein CAPSP0001_1539 [Capnocytophaga sputigena ATCC 33612]
MSTLYQLIQSEYKTEYISEYTKLKELMKKKYSAPKIYPKIISEKKTFSFFLKEKKKRF